MNKKNDIIMSNIFKLYVFFFYMLYGCFLLKKWLLKMIVSVYVGDICMIMYLENSFYWFYIYIVIYLVDNKFKV